MAKTIKSFITIKQALNDMKSWLDKQSLRSEEETKNLILAKRIVDLFLFFNDAGDMEKDIDSYDLNILFCFAFYLSKDCEFGYNRTFLNDKAEAFIKKRKDVRTQFESIIYHFNAVCQTLEEDLRPYRVQYNDLYVFLYDAQKKRWTARIKNGKILNILEKNTTFQLCQKTKFMTTNDVFYTKTLDGKLSKDGTVSDLKVILDI